ncbi:SDR family oxidoreductase [Stenotrophomonas sp. CC120222-04]|uniref:SDR family oxidoreductase n=1 Tax=Stenotrophomonas sp. CC120222-04 TaxID=1378088 RepID=UPI000B69C674|nr:SDR family oxidoreductase [Stenotrophomonas sp. CC120222-04]SNT83665.1 short chain dehydrogenase [Stenotrophomonas sp. CC120222-04]
MGKTTQTFRKGCVAVTGAGSGIGFATAEIILREGGSVLGGSRRPGEFQQLQSKYGTDRAHWVRLDVRDPESIAGFAMSGMDHFESVTSLVANAGVGYYGGISDLSDDQVFEMCEINYLGTVLTVRGFVPYLRANGGGDIVIVSSVAGMRSGSDEAVYAGTKAAQLIFAGGLDRELRQEGIRVSAVCPAGTQTNFAIGHGRKADDPHLSEYMAAHDVAAQVVYCLQQPPSMRTGIWTTWSMSQSS